VSDSLVSILAPYDAYLIDLWGVIHDGQQLYPRVLNTLELLQAQGKPVVFLSNAPRIAEKAIATLTKLGVSRGLYKEVVTSGQVAHDWLRDATPYGKNYYYLGPGKDEDIIADLPHYVKAATPEEADFILCTGYEYDFQPHEEILPLLAQLHEAELPMVCVNPDLEVVKQDGTVQLCAGAVAEAYAGEVVMIGKPHAEVYAVCRELLGPGKLLAVGDNPLTDIRGANAAGIDSLLITSGVLKSQAGQVPDEDEARDICRLLGVDPTRILPSFSL
jgi:HAD superfamily hydrolase (TIGR01459 family)